MGSFDRQFSSHRIRGEKHVHGCLRLEAFISKYRGKSVNPQLPENRFYPNESTNYENQVRDQSLSRMKNNIELMVATTGEKVVVIPHSMGVLYFLHFMKWVETPPSMGGGGGSDWCSKHIKVVMNIGGPFLGLPKIVAGLFSAEAKDIAVAR